MADSTLDPTREMPPGTRKGHGTSALGPSGSSDSGSDSSGTGKRATAGRDDDVGEAHDIAPDRIIGSELPMPADGLDRITVDDDTPDAHDPQDVGRADEQDANRTAPARGTRR